MINVIKVEAKDIDTTFSNITVMTSPDIEQWIDSIAKLCGAGLNQEGIDRLYYHLGRMLVIGVKIGAIKGKVLR